MAATVAANRATLVAVKESSKEAVESALISNNFYRDGGPLLFPQEIKTSSGLIIKANPNKTTTVLGVYVDDMDNIINGQISAPKSMIYDGGTRPGAFNVLNTPNRLYEAMGPNVFWEQVNRPFLDAAIKRGDDIILATKPEMKSLNRVNSDGSVVRSGYGREYDYLISKGYVYDKDTGRMVGK